MTTKKVIQVPVDEELLKNLNKLSKKQRKARAEIIRQACLTYLEQADEEEMDRQYEEGYRRIPETTEIAESQEAMLGEVLPKESW